MTMATRAALVHVTPETLHQSITWKTIADLNETIRPARTAATANAASVTVTLGTMESIVNVKHVLDAIQTWLIVIVANVSVNMDFTVRNANARMVLRSVSHLIMKLALTEDTVIVVNVIVTMDTLANTVSLVRKTTSCVLTMNHA